MTRLVSGTELAELLGVTQPAVSNAVAAKRLHYADPAKKLFDPIAAKAAWEANRQRRRTPKRPLSPSLSDTSAPRAPSGAVDGILSARHDRERAEADLALLKVGELRGALVRKVDVEREVFGVYRALRDSLMTVPPRIAGTLHNCTDLASAERALADELRDMLGRCAEVVRAGGSAWADPLRVALRGLVQHEWRAEDGASALAERVDAMVLAFLEDPPRPRDRLPQ